jgi:hypothetical protein
MSRSEAIRAEQSRGSRKRGRAGRSLADLVAEIGQKVRDRGLTDEQAVELLVDVGGISEDEARELLR